MKVLILALLLQSQPARTIAIDERLAADAGISVGDRVGLSREAGAPGDTVLVSALLRRNADPSQVARSEYRLLLHLDHLQSILGSGDRVDRFAIRTTSPDIADTLISAINNSAFGYTAHRSSDIAVETSRTFQVVSRFHRAIGVITIVASAVFLLCIMLLKVEERRREIATLRLIGISRRSVLISVVTESSVVALLGSIAGAMLGVVISAIVNSHYQAVYRTPLNFSIVTPGVLVFSVLLSVLLGIVAGFVVSLRMVRADPLELLGR